MSRSLAKSYSERPLSPARILANGLDDFDISQVGLVTIGFFFAWMVTATLALLPLGIWHAQDYVIMLTEQVIMGIYGVAYLGCGAKVLIEADMNAKEGVIRDARYAIAKDANMIGDGMDTSQLLVAAGDHSQGWDRSRRRLLLNRAIMSERHAEAMRRVDEGRKAELQEAYSNAIGILARTITSEYSHFLKTQDQSKARNASSEIEMAKAEYARLATNADGRTKRVKRKGVAYGNARVQGISTIGRALLEIDADATDEAGARIDSLVDRHLPALVTKHASAVGIARIEDIASIDLEFERGLEQVRASVEEAANRIRGERADELRTQVAFLKMRRGGETPALLRAVPTAAENL